MKHGNSMRPCKDIPVQLSHEEYQEQLLRISELEAKLSMYAHLAQAMDDIRLGRVQSADAVFDELLGELGAPQE